MSEPVPIPPNSDNVDQVAVVANVNAAVERIAALIGLPLSVSLDGQSVAEGSANEATIAAERILKLLQTQREMTVEAAPWAMNQVIRG